MVHLTDSRPSLFFFVSTILLLSFVCFLFASSRTRVSLDVVLPTPPSLNAPFDKVDERRSRVATTRRLYFFYSLRVCAFFHGRKTIDCENGAGPLSTGDSVQLTEKSVDVVVSFDRLFIFSSTHFGRLLEENRKWHPLKCFFQLKHKGKIFIYIHTVDFSLCLCGMSDLCC